MLLTRPLAEKRERLAALERLRRQLDPKAPLARGYALVCAPGHPVVTSREVAAAQDRLTLEFADGTLEVSPAGKRGPPRPKPASSPGDQPKLL
jgi:exodeoxyribonuclease VII large subunit